MVDLTKKPLREESWFRWKGGDKLAAKLRLQYTTPAALARIAAMNPMASDKTPGCKGCAARRKVIRNIFNWNSKTRGAGGIDRKPRNLASFSPTSSMGMRARARAKNLDK